MFDKAKWVLYRITFMVYMLLFALTGGLLGYLTGPLISYCFFKEASFFKYRRYFLPIAKCFWYMIYHWLSDKNYRRMSSIPLTAPPLAAPEADLVHLSEQWKTGVLDCHNCSKCCRQIHCPLLLGDGKCAAYKSFYWSYFNCGRYPSTAGQICYYSCPKWELNT